MKTRTWKEQRRLLLPLPAEMTRKTNDGTGPCRNQRHVLLAALAALVTAGSTATVVGLVVRHKNADTCDARLLEVRSDDMITASLGGSENDYPRDARCNWYAPDHHTWETTDNDNETTMLIQASDTLETVLGLDRKIWFAPHLARHLSTKGAHNDIGVSAS